MHVAASRLTDAAAKLGPDDRALLNLLVNHGLDEPSLLRVLRTDHAHFEARYLLLAERLGEVLELPPEYVQEQLDALIESAREHRANEAAAPNGAAAGAETTAPAERAPETIASSPAPAPAASSPAPPPAPSPAPPIAAYASARSPGRHRRRWRLAAALLAALAIVLVVVLSGGSSKRTPDSPTHTGTGGSSPVASTGVHDHAALTTLPGGPTGVTGSIGLSGPAAAPRLVVTVAGLPAAGTGHYEVWLYNSVIDSRALASLGTSGASVTVPLPAGYRRYRWIDVSRQPTGSSVHSGLSVLRVAVPGGV
jgi:hypothetical protein